MKEYSYKVLIQWREGAKVGLSESIDVETCMDHDKMVRILRECLLHVKSILEIENE